MSIDPVENAQPYMGYFDGEELVRARHNQQQAAALVATAHGSISNKTTAADTAISMPALEALFFADLHCVSFGIDSTERHVGTHDDGDGDARCDQTWSAQGCVQSAGVD